MGTVQDFYHHIGLFDYIDDKDYIGCSSAGRIVLNGLFISFSRFLTISFKCNAEDVELVSPLKGWDWLESYDSYKQANVCTASST